MNLIECRFESAGTGCAGTLMLPDGAEKPPVIVMAHGFGAIRHARLPAYAERFVQAGYGVSLFDYRTFGDSDGEPRQWVHPGKQVQDWEAAIRYVKTRPEVDPDRLVLWGTSFSGGHVLTLAAGHPELAAVISQVPHVSGLATILQAPWQTTAKCAMAGLIDLIGGLVNRPFYSPIIGEPGERAAITADGALENYPEMLPDDADWENRVLSRSFLYIPFYNPRRNARRIDVPTLVIAGRKDSVVPASAARRVAARIPRAEFQALDCNHFGPYFGERFEESVRLQLDFLRQHVPVDQAESGANR